MDIIVGDILLCKFYFSDLQTSKNRPVLVFKDNLPFNDFVGLPVSSKTLKLQSDEIIITNKNLSDGVLPVESKVMIRKAFVISKNNPVKKYGSLNEECLIEVKRTFCKYFECSNR
jgi:mRNA interferase MazF